jgi:hypothetical protein
MKTNDKQEQASSRSLPRLVRDCVTHHHACDCRERAILEILVLAEPIMEAWAKSHELEEWHCRVEDLIGTAYPSFMNLPNTQNCETHHLHTYENELPGLQRLAASLPYGGIIAK